MNEKANLIRNINITVIVEDNLITIPLQVIDDYAYSLCHGCIYGMEIYPVQPVSTIQKLLKELEKRKLKLNFEGFYCIKKRNTVYYPQKCESKIYV